MQGKIEEPNKN